MGKTIFAGLRFLRPGLTEVLEEVELQPLMDSLFPSDNNSRVIPSNYEFNWQDEYAVRPAEVMYAVWRKRYVNTAPGLDGIRSLVWRRAPQSMILKLGECYTACLREGTFPKAWKRAGLVLIPKIRGNDTEEPVKARPICLLSVTGKIFERVIAGRIMKWMMDNPRFDLSANQFGFRPGRSTCDALLKFRSIIEEAVANGKVVVAISLDVANAFNSMPFHQIIRVLIRNEFPGYLIEIIKNYLNSRVVEYPLHHGKMGLRTVYAGVPQGSVLGPLLWNIAYDEVLETRLDPGCFLIGYADDTLIIVTADSVDIAEIKANIQTAAIIRKIHKIGLSVATHKTEIAIFHGRRKPYRYPTIRVGEDYIEAKTTLKYLGIIFDSRLTFGDHFKYVAAKASKVVSALGRLMPNLKGPSEAKRRLYAGTVMSVLTYGSPVWHDAMEPVTSLARNRQAPMLRVQRFLALRVISAYRTVSLDAALILSRIPPIYILSGYYRRTYLRIRDLKSQNIWTPEEDSEIRRMERALMFRQWSIHINSRRNPFGLRIRNAVAPVFLEWMGHSNKWGCNFHLTQILSRHGCFADYLHRINREETNVCFHCGQEIDTAQHTLSECTAWHTERSELCQIVGPDLTIASVIRSMLSSEDKWNAVRRYCDTVMSQKEEAERIRRNNDRDCTVISVPSSPSSGSTYY